MIVIGIDPSLTNCGVSDGTHHEIVQTKPGAEDVDMVADLDRRCAEVCDGIVDFINQHHEGQDIVLAIEAPMLAAHGAGAHFLFEAGWLFHDLYVYLPCNLRARVYKTLRVPSPTLRKWATGKGNAPKDEMKLRAFKRFGIEFERDPGCDKLFAFLLSKFGEGVVAGEIAFEGPKRRGAGKDAKGIQKTAARKRAKGAA